MTVPRKVANSANRAKTRVWHGFPVRHGWLSWLKGSVRLHEISQISRTGDRAESGGMRVLAGLAELATSTPRANETARVVKRR